MTDTNSISISNPLPRAHALVLVIVMAISVGYMGTRLVLAVFGMMNWLMLLLIASHIPLQTGIYFWSSLLWFGWYFYGRRVYKRNGLAANAGEQVAG